MCSKLNLNFGLTCWIPSFLSNRNQSIDLKLKSFYISGTFFLTLMPRKYDESHRSQKPKVFWCFQGGSIGNLVKSGSSKSLTYFWPCSHFRSPWKHQKTFGFQGVRKRPSFKIFWSIEQLKKETSLGLMAKTLSNDTQRGSFESFRGSSSLPTS